MKRDDTSPDAYCASVEGKQRELLEALRVAHHLLLSHGRATRVIKGLRPDARVGIVAETLHVTVSV